MFEEEDERLENNDEGGDQLFSSVQRFEEMIRNKDNYFFDVDALIQIIDYYLERNLIDNGIKVANHALTLHPNSFDILVKKAQLLILGNMHDEAKKTIQIMEMHHPFEVDLFLIKGNYHVNLKQIDEAILNFEKALEISEQKDEIYYNMAIACQQISDYQRAIAYLKLCLEENPSFESGYDELTLCHVLTDSLDQAITFYKSLIDNNPYSYYTWYSLGNVYSRMSLYKKAIEAYEYSVIIKEDFVQALLEEGDAYAMLEQYEEAIFLYKSTFEYANPDAYTFYNLGECYEYLDNFEQARKYYKKAIKLNPHMAVAWFGIGSTLETEEKWFEAIYYIKKAAELDEYNADFWFSLAECYRHTNNIVSAEDSYRKVIEFEPENTEIWNSYSNFLLEYNRYEDAIELMAEAIKNHSDFAEYHFRMAAYLSLNDKNLEFHEYVESGLNLDFSKHKVLFEINPQLKNSEVVTNLIEQKRKLL